MRGRIEKALKSRRQLAQNDPDIHLPGVAQILNNMGKLDRDQNRMDDARAHYEEALKIRRTVDAEEPRYLLGLPDDS